MSRRPTTPADLAKKLDCDTDDVLIMLWDAGILYPKSPTSVIRGADVARAERACEVSSSREMTQIAYWERRAGLDRRALSVEATAMGIHWGENARKLPKGALSKLQKRFPTEPEIHEAPAFFTPEVHIETFVWSAVGHHKDTIQFLDRDQVEAIHFAIADDFRDGVDPISPAGVRDEHLLESATTRPQTSLGEHRKYPTVELAAAALMHSLVHNHAFFNGNKRTALVSVLSFLDRNGYMITCNQDELFRWTVRVAQHGLRTSERGDRSDMEVAEMAGWIMNNARPIGHGERVTTWKHLRRMLIVHGCHVESSGNRGGRVVVSKAVPQSSRGLFGSKEKLVEKKYSFPYGGDGRQVGRQRIKEMRRELQLSEDYGVDSDAFYGVDPAPVDEFIATYRKTLARLARV